jgi:cation:H+ antiporter
VFDLTLLIGGLLATGWFADALVKGSLALARRLRIDEATAGATILAFGTSAPELAVNLLASATGASGLVTSNVIGSNLFNTLDVLGACALVTKLSVRRWELPAGILATAGYLFLARDGLSATDGLLLLAGFLLFLGQALRCSSDDEEEGEPGDTSHFVVGMMGLPLAAAAVVHGATGLASTLGVPDATIGLTVVALGTSLPELSASLGAAFKGHSALAVGNVLGSNLFNLLLVLGASAVLAPLPPFDASSVLLVAALLSIWPETGSR